MNSDIPPIGQAAATSPDGPVEQLVQAVERAQRACRPGTLLDLLVPIALPDDAVGILAALAVRVVVSPHMQPGAWCLMHRPALVVQW